MTVSPKRVALVAAAPAALALWVPGAAEAGLSDPWPEITGSAVHIQAGDGGPFFVREPGADSPDVNLIGTVTGNLIEPGDWRAEMCLYWYGSRFSGTPDRSRIQCGLEIKHDGTVSNLNDITLDLFDEDDGIVEIDDGFVAGLYLIPEEDNPQTLQNEHQPLINPAVPSAPVARLDPPGFNGQLVGLGIYDKGTLPEQPGLVTGAADPWSSLNPLDLLTSQNLLDLITNGTPGVLSSLNVGDLMNFELQTMNADGGFILKGLGGNSASNFLQSNGSGLIGGVLTTGSMQLELMHSVFDGMARLDRHTATNTQQVRVPDILVDGKWIGYSVGEQAELGATDLPLEGFMPLTIVDNALGKSLDAGSGDLAFKSRDPIALCVDDDNDPEGDGDYDPGAIGITEPVCDHWKSAGFAIERTYALNGPAVTVTDTLVGTATSRAASSNVQLSYENAIDDPVSGNDLDPRFGIGGNTPAPMEGLAMFFPNAGTSMVIDGEDDDASGDPNSAVGQHTFNTAPDKVYFLDENPAEEAEDYVAQYTVPVGGSVVQTFQQARTIGALDDLSEQLPAVTQSAASTSQATTQQVTLVVHQTVEKFVSSTPGASAKTSAGEAITAPPSATVQQQAAIVASARAAAPRTCLVPRLRGRTRLGAERAIVRAGCSIGTVTTQRSRRIKKGHVISQSRAAYRVVPGGSVVKLRVSRGRR